MNETFLPSKRKERANKKVAKMLGFGLENVSGNMIMPCRVLSLLGLAGKWKKERERKRISNYMHATDKQLSK